MDRHSLAILAAPPEVGPWHFPDGLSNQPAVPAWQSFHGSLESTPWTEVPDSLTKVPRDSPFAKEMDVLIHRYSEVTAPLIKKGVAEHGGTPLDVEFAQSFPVACLLAAQFSGGDVVNYEETIEGLKITIDRKLECRAYHPSPKFVETAREWQRGERIPAGGDWVSFFFAIFNEMTWAFHTMPDPEKGFVEVPILAGIVLYLPENKIILAIGTKEKHEEVTKSMQERRYLEDPSSEGADKNQEPFRSNPNPQPKPGSRSGDG